VRFRFDACLVPGSVGQPGAGVAFRVPPEEAVELEFGTPRARGEWRAEFEDPWPSRASDRLYGCGGAGVTAF